MEHFTLFLAVVLLWLFFWRTTGAFQPDAKRTGALLVRVARVGPWAWARWLITYFLAVACVGHMGMVVWCLPRIPEVCARGGCEWTVLPLGVLLLAESAFLTAMLVRAGEGHICVCEGGIRRSSFHFRPWQEIRFCQWTGWPGRLLVQYEKRSVTFVLPVDKVAAVHAVLAGRVEVRDATGSVIAPAPATAAAGEEPRDRTRRHWRLPRRLLQFRLSTLILLVATVAAFLAWASIYARREIQVRTALAAIAHLEPQVLRDGFDVWGLEFERDFRDEDLPLLHDVPGLEMVCIRSGQITDDGLALLPKSLALERIELPPSIGDDGLKHLARFPRLYFLDLSRTHATGTGLADLRGLSDLRAVELGASATDAGLACVASFECITYLKAGGPQVSDAGLAHLAALPQLTQLDLSGTAVTDAGLERLRPLTQLKSLNLSGTAITDAGLAHLERLPALEHVDLTGTQITPAGMLRLEKAFPNAIVLPGTPAPATPQPGDPATGD